MSSEKKYTERDLVLAKREGYARARGASGLLTPYGIECARAEAAGAFPLPKRTQPRVVKDPNRVHDAWWAVRDGELCWTDADPDQCRFISISVMWDASSVRPTRERVALWADLLANPLEEVEDDA